MCKPRETSHFQPFLTEWHQTKFAPSEELKSLTTRFLFRMHSLVPIKNDTDMKGLI